MAPDYPTPTAFRQALLARLKQAEARRGATMQTLLQQFVMERFLVRLLGNKEGPWLLKGGYGLHLRYRPQVRVTRDIDLSLPAGGGDVSAEEIQRRLSVGLHTTATDPLVFVIHAGRAMLDARAFRYRVAATLAGKPLAGFGLDVSTRDLPVGPTEYAQARDTLGLKGLPVANIPMVPLAQHFAEKLHALTYRYEDRVNTRVKDLVDLVLLIERSDLNTAAVEQAIETTFTHRATHPRPSALTSPADSWSSEYARLAREAEVGVLELDDAIRLVSDWLTERTLFV